MDARISKFSKFALILVLFSAGAAAVYLFLGRERLGKRARVRVSASTFVPKPHTPFQWEPLSAKSSLQEQIELLLEAYEQHVKVHHGPSE